MTPSLTAAPPTLGLSSGEAAARRRRGEGNDAVSASSRTYGRIVRTNVLNLYNSILFSVGVALLALGRPGDALISVGIGVLNAAISAVQEIRAKRQLDRLQLLARGTVVVVRDGADTEVGPEEVVRGDVVRVRPGDQLVVDGPVLAGQAEVDESLLTGESDAQLRSEGEDLLSGSVVVGGAALQLARDVGADSHAQRLTAEARRATTDTTPLQRRIAFVVRLTMLLVVLMSGAILAQAALEGLSLVRVVQITAVLSGLVPYGLFFLIALAYTAGAVTTSRQGALVQRVNAVESVSNVDVLCTDKTGTLTTGRLTVAELVPLGGQDGATVTAALAAMAHSTGAPNLTSAALAGALPGAPVAVVEEVPFSSALRWSAVRTAGATWVLGAPEALTPALGTALPPVGVTSRTAQGLRVLVFARATDPAAPLRDAAGRPVLPGLEALALVALADELRPDVPATLARFAEEGIAVTVLSGDDPGTVAALAARAGLRDATGVHAGHFPELTDAELEAVVATGSVFGRVAPEQKERVVTALRRQGHHVAMVGDGVNDARALKAAQVGVAMASGSAVTRDVADIVLTGDSLAALVPARRLGRRLIAGITTSAQLFLARVATQALVIVAVTMLGLGFPYSPAQGGLTLFTVGLPTLVLTAWARPAPPDPHVLGTLGRFVVPAALLTAGGGVAVYAFLYTGLSDVFTTGRAPDFVVTEFESYTGLTYGTDADFAEAASAIGAQTGLNTFVSLASVLLVLFLVPPARVFAVFTPVTDRRTGLLVAGLLVVLLAALLTPAVSTYLGLTGAAPPVYTIVLPVLVLWFLALGAAYRFRVLDRLLGLRELPAG
ncbi:HAD-IC family P-type ATPase [Modestobacter sp. VKM Ac-2986]|uniref:HAD-IC family P-type ATPase n=1 Tax=Modestobacter sp. VKM Ac-2986 TaxID=3004140 RepID=UPI0022AAFB74|nr:HAD-IC family P-type ATPase [Modestobacter sp. VKM Ac-2986]MCZ2828867.1 HAD-IC family P-type ATPase [Modestobacter sp. VKM Ac-2986]